jgi:hypothetical protein
MIPIVGMTLADTLGTTFEEFAASSFLGTQQLFGL